MLNNLINETEKNLKEILEICTAQIEKLEPLVKKLWDEMTLAEHTMIDHEEAQEKAHQELGKTYYTFEDRELFRLKDLFDEKDTEHSNASAKLYYFEELKDKCEKALETLFEEIA